MRDKYVKSMSIYNEYETSMYEKCHEKSYEMNVENYVQCRFT